MDADDRAVFNCWTAFYDGTFENPKLMCTS